MKFKLNKNTSISTKIFIFLILFTNIKSFALNAEESYLKEVEIDSSTQFNNNAADIPTNPFEIVEMIRRATSMNDATKPSDAVDDALKLFYKIDEKENL